MFLTPEQLHDLTDRRGAAAQTRWLTERGFKFVLGASGRPKVLMAEVQRRMLSSTRVSRELDLKAIC